MADGEDQRWDSSQRDENRPRVEVELEAVVSCTSDGLVVVLRRARPFYPPVAQPAQHLVQQRYANGLFASPWAAEPIMPNFQETQTLDTYDRSHRSTLGPMRPTPTPPAQPALAGPQQEDCMNSIREVADFAWALTGINGSLAQYSRGNPIGQSQPPDGLPIWDPNSNAGPEVNRYTGYDKSPYRYNNTYQHYDYNQRSEQWSGA